MGLILHVYMCATPILLWSGVALFTMNTCSLTGEMHFNWNSLRLTTFLSAFQMWVGQHFRCQHWDLQCLRCLQGSQWMCFMWLRSPHFEISWVFAHLLQPHTSLPLKNNGKFQTKPQNATCAKIDVSWQSKLFKFGGGRGDWMQQQFVRLIQATQCLVLKQPMTAKWPDSCSMETPSYEASVAVFGQIQFVWPPVFRISSRDAEICSACPVYVSRNVFASVWGMVATTSARSCIFIVQPWESWCRIFCPFILPSAFFHKLNLSFCEREN